MHREKRLHSGNQEVQTELTKLCYFIGSFLKEEFVLRYFSVTRIVTHAHSIVALLHVDE